MIFISSMDGVEFDLSIFNEDDRTLSNFKPVWVNGWKICWGIGLDDSGKEFIGWVNGWFC